MRSIYDPREMQRIAVTLRKQGKTIGFVPTMGYFHEGHLSLMREARLKNDILIVSLFVNPTQFGPKEDLDRYPRDLNRDTSLALAENVDFLFSPEQEKMYPEHFQSFIQVRELSKPMCGKYREGHFEGVTTVVLKLFNIVKPHQSYFGQKDFQQAVIIQRMVVDLNLDVDVIILPTIREPDGLAMSSRNVLLSSRERESASILYQTLVHGSEMIASGEREVPRLYAAMNELLARSVDIEVQYLDIRDTKTLTRWDTGTLEGTVVIAIAAFIGVTRLIDNVVVSSE